MATAKKPELGGSCPSCGSAMRACEDCSGPCGVFVCMNANCGDGPKQPVEPLLADESLIARNHALREALRNVLRLIDCKAFMAHEDLEVVWRAEAALVEDER